MIFISKETNISFAILAIICIKHLVQHTACRVDTNEGGFPLFGINILSHVTGSHLYTHYLYVVLTLLYLWCNLTVSSKSYITDSPNMNNDTYVTFYN